LSDKKPSEPNTLAFEELVRKYQKRLYSVAYSFTGSHERAEELSQEAFLKAYQNLPKFRHESQIYTWLYRILLNLCIDETRKKKYLHVSIDEVNIPDGFSSDRAEETIMLREALDRLFPQQKVCIVLHDIEGYTYKEMAEILHCPMGTVMSRTALARQKLRQIIEQDFPDLISWKPEK